MINPELKLGKYLNLEQFCTCTQTYQRHRDSINPYPQTAKSVDSLVQLNYYLLDPIIDHFGWINFQLTYGFCSLSLKKYLQQKDPITGKKNGRVAPELDQHCSEEVNSKGNRICRHSGAACDFQVLNTPSNQIVAWIVEQKLPFDSLYFYGENRPIHLSYGPRQKKAIWTFTPTGQPHRGKYS